MSDASRIPPEAQKLIAEFEANQRVQEAQKAVFRPPKFEKGSAPETRKQWTTTDMKKYALSLGFQVETIGGKHCQHIVASDGKYVASLPDHPGNLATGTARGILKKLAEYQASLSRERELNP